MKISEIMTRNPITVTTDDLVRNAKRVMAEHAIKHLPVVGEDGSVLGIVTDRDIKLQQAISEDPGFHTTAPVLAVALKDPYCVAPDTPARQVVRYLADNRIGSALIVDDGMLIGIFTSTDACRVLAELLE